MQFTHKSSIVSSPPILHSYKLVDKISFLRALLDGSYVGNLEYPSLYPAPPYLADIVIHQVKFAPGSESTYMLSYNNILWLDRSEYKYFHRWISTSDENTYHIVFPSPVLKYHNISEIYPIWITGGLSRGSHSFHYAHFAVDQLIPSLYVKDLMYNLNPCFIQDTLLPWQKNIIDAYPFDYQPLVLTHEISLRNLPYPNIVSHMIQASLFDFSPQYDTISSRNALFRHYFHAREAASALEHFEDDVLTIETPIWLLSRSKVPNIRLINENHVIDSLNTVFLNVSVLCPEDYCTDDLLYKIHSTKPLIISACSGALDPLMLLVKYFPRIIMFVPFTRREINESNAAGLYRDIPRISRSEDRVALLGLANNIVGSSWNTPIRVECIMFINLLCSFVGTKFSARTIEQRYYESLHYGEYAVRPA